jgi:histidyl-tRNA synthetase
LTKSAKESSRLKEKFKIPKGFQDVIPPHISVWQYIENTASRTFRNYGYKEIRIPVVEHTEVFVRSIGESTDIVEKEMYTFRDRADRSLTLRPEGTAPLVRCYVQHGLHTQPSPQKYYYSGPMFRYERPQKGRLRQFYQIGAEAFGVDDPYIDAEMIGMIRDFLQKIGMSDLSYEINSIGCADCRPDYKIALKEYISSKLNEYCEDCNRRYDTNTLRVLDCKVPGCKEASLKAPLIKDYLCENCKDHFGSFRTYLEEMNIGYEINPRIVRGLDYYTRTIFEITTTELGSQNAVVAGGRYDRLVEEFGGPSMPAVGFALGMERLAELVSHHGKRHDEVPNLFVICMNENARNTGISIVQKLRSGGLWCEINYSFSALGKQLKRADRAGARYVFIIGDDELEAGNVKYKRLSDGKEGHIGIDNFDEMVETVSRTGGQEI